MLEGGALPIEWLERMIHIEQKMREIERDLRERREVFWRRPFNGDVIKAFGSPF